MRILGVDRIIQDVGDPTDCWLWSGSTNSKGYGTVRIEGKTETVHRIVWKLFVNEALPSNIRLDHLCLTKHCFNPEHLEEVTDLVNNRRRFGWKQDSQGNWYCSNDHLITEETSTKEGSKTRCDRCRADTRRLKIPCEY